MAATLCAFFGLLAIAVGEERVMNAFRVPPGVEPTHYTVKILTTLADDFNYLGEVENIFLRRFCQEKMI